MRPCEHWTDGTYCGEPRTHQYVSGPRCVAHTPAKMANREDLVPDPESTLEAIRRKAGRVESFNPNDTALNDQIAIATGKRRSNPGAYRNATAAENARKAARR